MSRTKTRRTPQADAAAYTDFFDSIQKLVKHLGELYDETVIKYDPIVNRIINSGCKDRVKIQKTLDCLLESCGNPLVLQLFKRLCRYYYCLDQTAASKYIGFYLYKWEPERYRKMIKSRTKN